MESYSNIWLFNLFLLTSTFLETLIDLECAVNTDEDMLKVYDIHIPEFYDTRHISNWYGIRVDVVNSKRLLSECSSLESHSQQWVMSSEESCNLNDVHRFIRIVM